MAHPVRQSQSVEVRRALEEANKSLAWERGSGENTVTSLIPETKNTGKDNLRQEESILAHCATCSCLAPRMQADHYDDREIASGEKYIKKVARRRCHLVKLLPLKASFIFTTS